MDELEGVEFRRLTDEAQPHVAAAQRGEIAIAVPGDGPGDVVEHQAIGLRFAVAPQRIAAGVQDFHVEPAARAGVHVQLQAVAFQDKGHGRQRRLLRVGVLRYEAVEADAEPAGAWRLVVVETTLIALFSLAVYLAAGR